MNIFSKLLTIGILLVLPLFRAGAQDVKAQLFNEANEMLQVAKNTQADILAPENYSKGLQFYRDAEKDYQKGKNLDGIRKDLRSAIAYFKRATDATRLAEVTFVNSIKARLAAKDAEAARFSSGLWQKAEAKFEEAAKVLEGGNVNTAKKRSSEAEKLYRDAELAAIKANYLKETWDLLAMAEQNKLIERAPKTLKHAQDLIREAEKELNDNRYDTDYARNLAQQAKYEAQHALYIGKQIEQMKRAKSTSEDLILDWEIPLQQVAGLIEVPATLSSGYSETTKNIMEKIQGYEDSLSAFTGYLSDRNQQISSLQERITELEGQVGSYAEQQTELKKRIDAEAKVREQYRTVERMFTREEAKVSREGSDVIIRLVGLNFPSGKSTIQPEYFSLLTKVQNAITTFPGSQIVIEGHTDSFGGDEVNLKLSEDRANSVQQYILANLHSITIADIEAKGYGESQPIANNETPEGRTKNRRIDIVIRKKNTVADSQ